MRFGGKFNNSFLLFCEEICNRKFMSLLSRVIETHHVWNKNKTTAHKIKECLFAFDLTMTNVRLNVNDSVC